MAETPDWGAEVMFGPQKPVRWTPEERAEVAAARRELWEYMRSGLIEPDVWIEFWRSNLNDKRNEAEEMELLDSLLAVMPDDIKTHQRLEGDVFIWEYLM